MKYCLFIGIYLYSLIWNTYGSDYSPPDCGGNKVLYATNETQNLTSPNYPNYYANNLDCKWTIHATTKGRQIRITGEVELDDPSSQLCLDTLKIYQGSIYISDSTLLSSWCGENTIKVQSTADVVIVAFSTSYTTTDKGFHLQFFETSEPLPYDISLTTRLVHQYLFPSPYIYSKSRGYPAGYEANSTFTWIIHRDRIGKYIQLEFKEYAGQYQPRDCTQNYVNIYDGPSEDSPMIGQYCGAEAMLVTGSADSVFVRHVTGNAPVGRGFKMYYYSRSSSTISTTAYKFIRLGETQYITSLNHPYMYPNNIVCSWGLSVSDCYNCVIVMKVLKSDIQYSPACDKDRLAVYDGSVSSAWLGQRLCGNGTSTYTSTGTSMNLRFTTDGSGVGTGFNLSYTAIKRTPTTERPTGGLPEPSLPVGAIIGIVIGATGVLTLIGVAIIYLKRKPYRNRPEVVTAAPYVTTYSVGQQNMTIQPPWSGGQVWYVGNVNGNTAQMTNGGTLQSGGSAFINGGGQQAYTNGAYSYSEASALPPADTSEKKDIHP